MLVVKNFHPLEGSLEGRDLSNARHVIFAHPVSRGVGWMKSHRDALKFSPKDIEEYALRSVRNAGLRSNSKVHIYRIFVQDTIQQTMLQTLKQEYDDVKHAKDGVWMPPKDKSYSAKWIEAHCGIPDDDILTRSPQQELPQRRREQG